MADADMSYDKVLANQYTEKVGKDVTDKIGPANFSPLVAIAIAGLIIDAIRLYKECKQPATTGTAKRQFFLRRYFYHLSLIRFARKRLREQNCDVKYAEALAESVYETTANMTDEQITSLVK